MRVDVNDIMATPFSIYNTPPTLTPQSPTYSRGTRLRLQKIW